MGYQRFQTMLTFYGESAEEKYHRLLHPFTWVIIHLDKHESSKRKKQIVNPSLAILFVMEGL